MRSFGRVARVALLSLAITLPFGCSSPPKSTPAATRDSATPTPAPDQAQPSPPPPPPKSASKPPPPAAQPQSPKSRAESTAIRRHPIGPVTTEKATAAPDEYAQGEQLQAWKNSLKTGAAEYRVPTAMIAGQTSTVTVVIHGFQDAQSRTMPDATGTGTLKVSSRMKAELLAPLNPGEFTIAPQSGDLIQFIPNDGFATWIWNVTPSAKAKDQQLQIRVSLVYNGPAGQLQQTIEEKTYTVSVNVEKLSETVGDSFRKDPIAWFKYMLPGGAGWGALAAFVSFLGGLGWWSKRKRRKARHAAHSATR